jgi:hypothetical protein
LRFFRKENSIFARKRPFFLANFSQEVFLGQFLAILEFLLQGSRNSLAGVAVSQWFIETTLAGWVADFIYVCLETRWLGPKPWFLSPG